MWCVRGVVVLLVVYVRMAVCGVNVGVGGVSAVVRWWRIGGGGVMVRMSPTQLRFCAVVQVPSVVKTAGRFGATAGDAAAVADSESEATDCAAAAAAMAPRAPSRSLTLMLPVKPVQWSVSCPPFCSNITSPPSAGKVSSRPPTRQQKDIVDADEKCPSPLVS